MQMSQRITEAQMQLNRGIFICVIDEQIKEERDLQIIDNYTIRGNQNRLM